MERYFSMVNSSNTFNYLHYSCHCCECQCRQLHNSVQYWIYHRQDKERRHTLQYRNANLNYQNHEYHDWFSGKEMKCPDPKIHTMPMKGRSRIVVLVDEIT